MAKPSTLWPVPTQPEKGGRIVPAESNLPPKPGNADTLKPSLRRINKEREAKHDVFGTEEQIKTQEEMLDQDDTGPSISEEADAESDRPGNFKKELESYGLDHWEPNPPKIMMEDPNAHPLELRSQIQMYATTEYVKPYLLEEYQGYNYLRPQATYSSARISYPPKLARKSPASLYHRR